MVPFCMQAPLLHDKGALLMRVRVAALGRARVGALCVVVMKRGTRHALGSACSSEALGAPTQSPCLSRKPSPTCCPANQNPLRCPASQALYTALPFKTLCAALQPNPTRCPASLCKPSPVCSCEAIART